MYKLVVAGGTFDLLHRGHKSFLNQILDQTDKLILGLTTDSYVSKNKEGSFENYETRKKNLEDFLSHHKDRVEVVPIDDIFGPLLKINPDVLAVTEETKKSIDIINSQRQNLGLSILPSIVISMDLSEDGFIISSTRIRNGEINREGRLYFNTKWQGKNFSLPDNLRYELSKPFGKILDNIPSALIGEEIITVGDVTTKLFNENRANQFLSIIDFRVNRKREFNSTADLGFDEGIKITELENSKGEITSDLVMAIKEAFKNKVKSVILIHGEDDLAVLPCLLFSPLGYSIFYGQPSKGLVKIAVSEDVKDKAYGLLSKFLIS